MADNRCSCGQGNSASGGGRETVCIDTMRILDSCRDRDCYEDVRVYLTPFGQEIIDRTTTVRTTCAKIVAASVSTDPIPFNCGFYQVTARYYIKVSFEACVAACNAQEFSGLVAIEKSVVLYGGTGGAQVFRSDGGSFCCPTELGSACENRPEAVVEVVSPIVLSTKVVGPECGCCTCVLPCCCDGGELPGEIACHFPDGAIGQGSGDGNRLLVSIGIFSVVRLERPTQLLITGTEYAVPDKECRPATDEEDPCCLFRTMAFPIKEFGTTASGCDPCCGK